MYAISEPQDELSRLQIEVAKRTMGMIVRANKKGLPRVPAADLQSLAVKVYDAGFRCEYCGDRMEMENPNQNPRGFSFDHRIPLGRGGENIIENIAICCHRCNMAKGDMTEEEFRRMLLDLPDPEREGILNALYAHDPKVAWMYPRVTIIRAPSWKVARVWAKRKYRKRGARVETVRILSKGEMVKIDRDYKVYLNGAKPPEKS